LDLLFSPEDLTRLYRFALLLTGEEGVAEQVLYDACVECAARLAGYRNEQGRKACLMGNIRQKAKQLPASEGRGIARAFASLPEEERAALAGLYSGLLPACSLAEALKMSLAQMGGVLKTARERLERTGKELGEPSLERAL